VNSRLRNAGWRSLRIWEHDLSARKESRLATRIRKQLSSGLPLNYNRQQLSNTNFSQASASNYSSLTRPKKT
jgi:hypothetical protein